MVKKIHSSYAEVYGSEPQLVSSSPGRINLIGEHTDYNEGFVLPASIDKSVFAALGKRPDDKVCMYSVDFNEIYETEISKLFPSETVGWSNYVTGIVAVLIRKNFPVTGFNVSIGGNIPIGAGLSSSAAIECAVIYGLNELFQLGIEKKEMVKMAQKAEHEFAGVKCGVMDQFASMFGKKNHVLRLDCRSLEYAYEPFMMDDFKVVLFDTNVKHSLASSEYNVRRKQCETGVAMIQQHVPSVKSLRDANLEFLNKYVLPEDITVYRRCKYVIQENTRLLEACKDLEKNDFLAFGRKMFETHEGLSKLYEVSCPELDFLVSHVLDIDAVLGARMMGGGFGGCTINLVKKHAIDKIAQDTSVEYKNTFGKDLRVYIVSIEDGSTVIK